VAEQGASNGAGQAAGKSFVSFSRGAAQRIAKAVRTVEGGDRSQPGLTFDHPQFGRNDRVFRVCTYTGSWSVGSSKTITFKYQTSTPNTAVATNLFFPVTGTASADCAIAKDGTAWFLIDVPLYTATAVLVKSITSKTYVTDISLSASLNTSNCSITVNKTISTATASFVSASQTATFIVLEKP
jgi:hypothetical protein